MINIYTPFASEQEITIEHLSWHFHQLSPGETHMHCQGMGCSIPVITKFAVVPPYVYSNDYLHEPLVGKNLVDTYHNVNIWTYH